MMPDQVREWSTNPTSVDICAQTLFEEDADKRARLIGILDEINGRFGKWTG